MKETKFVALGDIHFGYEKVITPGGLLLTRPVHDVASIIATLRFIKDYKPDQILLMGDNFDMKPVSRHDLGIPKQQEGQRLIEVYSKGYEFFLKPLLNLCNNIHWFDGNHEAWAYQLAEKFPGIDGMITPYDYLRLKEEGIRFHPQGDIYKIGKLAFAHGDQIISSQTGGAKRAVDRYGSSIRIWHFHTYQAYSKETLKNAAYQTGVLVPCLCNRSPSYSKGSFNTWVQGFDYGVVESSGNFHDTVAVIWQGKFVANGKVYDGKSR